MLVDDARGNPVTASDPLPVTLLDDTVESYLGFRKDTGERLKAALTSEPDFVLAHCLRGYFMMLFGQRAMVGASERADELVETLETRLAEARKRAACLPKLPRVFFEEWDDPMISGIGWVLELIEIAGGIDIFADRSNRGAAKDRIVTAEGS